MTRLTKFRAPLLCVALAFASAALTDTGYSQVINAPAAAKVVKQVRIVFSGPASISEARVRAQMALREGEAYSKEIEDQDLRNLYATGTVDNVSITTTEGAGGVIVTVTITGRGAIGDIVFQGNTQVSSSKLTKDIELKTGEPVDEVRIAAGSQKIRERYEKQGYSDVSVSYQTEVIQGSGFTRVTFIVNEGARGLVRKINFEGNSVMKAAHCAAR